VILIYNNCKYVWTYAQLSIIHHAMFKIFHSLIECSLRSCVCVCGMSAFACCMFGGWFCLLLFVGWMAVSCCLIGGSFLFACWLGDLLLSVAWLILCLFGATSCSSCGWFALFCWLVGPFLFVWWGFGPSCLFVGGSLLFVCLLAGPCPFV
jgi:hypothetical protein